MKEEQKITMPDFQVWAASLFSNFDVHESIIKVIAVNLKTAFDQGESYGVFKGYNAGYNRGHQEGFIKGQDAAQILRNLTDIVGGK
jgi:flagellar biosynthesis/type III secretory pathway protein FliH